MVEGVVDVAEQVLFVDFVLQAVLLHGEHWLGVYAGENEFRDQPEDFETQRARKPYERWLAIEKQSCSLRVAYGKQQTGRTAQSG